MTLTRCAFCGAPANAPRSCRACGPSLGPATAERKRLKRGAAVAAAVVAGGFVLLRLAERLG